MIISSSFAVASCYFVSSPFSPNSPPPPTSILYHGLPSPASPSPPPGCAQSHRPHLPAMASAFPREKVEGGVEQEIWMPTPSTSARSPWTYSLSSPRSSSARAARLTGDSAPEPPAPSVNFPACRAHSRRQTKPQGSVLGLRRQHTGRQIIL